MTETLPPDPPDDADPEVETTSLIPDRAVATVDVGVAFTLLMPEPPTSQLTLTQNYAAMTVERYYVYDGIPQDLPPYDVTLGTRVGIGTPDFTDIVPDPLGVDTGADLRWLPLDSTFTEGEDWRPFSGDPSLRWTTAPNFTPYLDPDYSYARGEQEINRPAMIFDGSAHLHLNTSGWTANAVTIGIVAVLGPGYGPQYSILESSLANDPPPDIADDPVPAVPDVVDEVVSSAPVNFGLRNLHGTLQFWAGSQVVDHVSSALPGEPTIMVLSLDPDEGRLAVVDRNRSTRTFSLDRVSLFDVELLLGSGDAVTDATATAVMDVLEIDCFFRGLSFNAIEGYLAQMAETYGIRT